jgi:branched-chain amino acid transport system permease protein
MGLSGAIAAHFIGFIAPENYTSSLTFQVWTMLIVGGSGNNLGAIIGAGLVWALWAASGLAIADLVPASFEARAATLRIIAIGVFLATMIVLRPRGLVGEKATVSRHLD